MKNKILIIEDHDSIRMLLSNFFNPDFEVVTKADGLEGLAWLSSGNIPDFIVLDYSMPRVNGYQFLKNIRQSGFFRDIPVIILTATEDLDFQEKISEFGIVDFLLKPFNPVKLREKIQEVLAEKVSQNVE